MYYNYVSEIILRRIGADRTCKSKRRTGSLARVRAGGYHPQWHGPSADVWAPPRAAGGSAGEDGAENHFFCDAIFLSCETRSFAKTRSRLTERKVEQKAGCFSQSEEAQRVTRWCQWARWDY